MATAIIQKPLYTTMPIGQEMIFVVSNNIILSTEIQVKFRAEIFVSDELPPVMALGTVSIGTFKTTPNNEGKGIFNVSEILENYVSADNLSFPTATFKREGNPSKLPFTTHYIDTFTMNQNAVRYVAIKFSTEYLYLGSGSQNNQIVSGGEINSDSYIIFNGYLKHSDELILGQGGFGYPLDDFDLLKQVANRFLTNAPMTQWARNSDYGTLSYLGGLQEVSLSVNIDPVTEIYFEFFPEYDAQGISLGNDTMIRDEDKGAYDTYGAFAREQLMYFGVFPGNIRAWSSSFLTLLNAGSIKSYTVTARYTTGGVSEISSETLTVNLLCKNLKGYEQVRLTWLNQWGTWDYYSFNQKSVKSISTKNTTYNQLGGTWNKGYYRPYGFKGGKKSFRVNATEKIKISTDYLTEEHSEWFEELVNSPEVYILKAWQYPNVITGAQTVSTQNDFVTPVRLLTTNFTKKTVANDKLIQYNFEVEKARTLRTQSI